MYNFMYIFSFYFRFLLQKLRRKTFFNLAKRFGGARK